MGKGRVRPNPPAEQAIRAQEDCPVHAPAG
jgi:hypothetical protein